MTLKRLFDTVFLCKVKKEGCFEIQNDNNNDTILIQNCKKKNIVLHSSPVSREFWSKR
jgi:preprotein translocase subunit SecB